MKVKNIYKDMAVFLKDGDKKVINEGEVVEAKEFAEEDIQRLVEIGKLKIIPKTKKKKQKVGEE